MNLKYLKYLNKLIENNNKEIGIFIIGSLAGMIIAVGLFDLIIGV